MKFYIDLLTSSLPHKIEECIQAIPRRVLEEMNKKLPAPYTNKEVSDALFQLNAFGVPSPNGFPAHFYQKFWPTIYLDVSSCVLNILINSAPLDDINSNFIVLIPKVKEAKRVEEFTISLCNVIYKIVATVIANRIKHILTQIISPNQSTFVHDWLIYVNIIVAYETLHPMITKCKGNNRFMALKLDMSRAYDRAEWYFLKVVMLKWGSTML